MPFVPFSQTPARQPGGVEKFVKGMISPVTNYAEMVGEAVGSAGRFAFDPTFRKSTMGGQLTDAEAEHLANLKPFFMDEQELGKFSDPGSAAMEGAKRTGGMMAMVLPGGGATLAGKAAMGAASGGLLGFADSEGFDPKAIFTGAVTGGVAAPAMSMFGNAVKGGAKKAFSKIGPSLTEAGEGWVTRGIGNPIKQAELVKKSGITMSDLFDEFNLYSRDPDAAAAAKKAIYKSIEGKTLNSTEQVNLRNIVQGIDDRVAEIVGPGGIKKPTKMAKMSTTAMAEAKALLQQKKNILKIVGAKRGQVPEEAPMALLAQYKKDVIDANLPKNAWAITDTKQTGTIAGQKGARKLISGAMDAVDPEISTLGRKYGMMKGVEKILTNSQARANNRQPINFTKMGIPTVGALTAGIPGAVGGFLGEQIVNSPAGIRAVSKGLKTAGKVATGASKVSLPSIDQVAPEVLAKVVRNTASKMPIAGATAVMTQQNPYTAPVQTPTAPQSGFKPFPNQQPTGPVSTAKPNAKLPAPKPLATPKGNYNLGTTNFNKVQKLRRSSAY